ncbi:molybdopterin-binding protein [Clostridium grantii]|uniref:Molybdopterin molybdenumtransferase n=1 Tax=Clostridium grantii DSM 8605 TaxID=1121316 RepID=A0A1M5WFY2_9CLOT|nr:molybdopterin-binding protein [Clostridium grantii]SHH86402.1 molybdenum cofactor synthesis domain-containing protein [Clostridium grantii DSM 8605]
MKSIKVEEAIGTILCHDITQIIPGKFKGRAFKKGHIITAEDVKVLLSIGKEHIFVWEPKEGTLHENEAAIRLKDLTAGEGLVFSEIKEGKIDFIAERDGLLKVDKEVLLKLNSLDEIILATLHNNMPVKKGQKVAGTRVVPLVIDEEKIIMAEKLVQESVVKVVPINPKKVGIVTTGSEVYNNRIKDAFGPVIIKKVEEFNCEVLGQSIINDDVNIITKAIKEWIDKGAELVICTGGMSVDPDDMTPTAIKNTGANLVSYGSPVLPGAMFLLAYDKDTAILGLPGCVMYSKRTVFDLVLPRVLAGEKLNKQDIAELGHGGLCMDCHNCIFPNCGFGK